MTEGGHVAPGAPVFDDDDEGTGHGVVRIAAVAALGGLLFGYDSAVINGATTALEKYFDIGSAGLGFAVASVLLGAATGAMTAGKLADQFGRVRVMQVAAALFLVSSIGAAVATNLETFIVFRIVGGAGIGIASVIAPAYIAEVSPTRIRGRLGSLQQLAIVTGIFLSLLIDFVMASLAGDSSQDLWFGIAAWRWMFLVMAIPAAAYGLLSLTIPESPRFLVARQRIPEARKVLTILLGEKNLDLKLHRIENTLNTEQKPRLRDLYRRGTILMPIVWVGVLLSVFQQAVGINVIFYYSNILWQSVGFSEDGSFVATVITAVTNVLTTIVAIALVDRIGRKPLLLIGSAGMSVSLVIMTVIFATARLNDEGKPVLGDVAGPVALVCANLFVIAFGMSWGPVVWVLLGEMFPNRIRAAALSVAAAAQWVANWVITVSFPGLKDISLGLAYGIYAASAILSLLFVMRFVRETKGIGLEEMPSELVKH